MDPYRSNWTPQVQWLLEGGLYGPLWNMLMTQTPLTLALTSDLILWKMQDRGIINTDMSLQLGVYEESNEHESNRDNSVEKHGSDRENSVKESWFLPRKRKSLDKEVRVEPHGKRLRVSMIKVCFFTWRKVTLADVFFSYFPLSLTLHLTLPLGKFSFFFLVCCFFFQNQLFWKILSGIQYLSVKQIGSRLDPKLCLAWSGSKLFAKVFSRQLLEKDFKHQTLR